jgi:hypothetical protein
MRTQGPGAPSPSLKKPPQPVLPAARQRKYYDSARNVTYVNVDITLTGHRAGSVNTTGANANGAGAKDAKTKGKKDASKKDAGATADGAPAADVRGVALVFQLIYKGATTTDLSAAYLFVQATAPPDEPARLSAVKRLDMDADGYLFGYDRVDYRTETFETKGAAALVLQREAAVFELSPADLPQMANAGRLAVKFGAETFTVNSVQLAELRSTLISGAD